MIDKSSEEAESSSQIDLSKEKSNKMYSYLHQLGIYRVLSIEIVWLMLVQYLSFDGSSLKGEPRRFLAIPSVPIPVKAFTNFPAPTCKLLAIKKAIGKSASSSMCGFSFTSCQDWQWCSNCIATMNSLRYWNLRYRSTYERCPSLVGSLD
jgi:hypothetical protein